MKTYTVPFGRMEDYKHPHPDRTATKAGWDVVCKIFPSRQFMLNALGKQDPFCNNNGGHWHALKKDQVNQNMLTCKFTQEPI